MSSIDLALVAGVGLCTGWLVFLLRRRRTRGRLQRLSRHRSALPARRGRRLTRARLTGLLVARPATAVGAGGAVAGGAGLLLGGPVAAVCVAAYTVVGLLAVRRQVLRRSTDRAIAGLLDAIDDTVGDLRAGVTVSAGALRGGGRSVRERLRHDAVISVAVARLDAAQRVSEALGIPLADLLDRVDTDLRDVQALRLDLTAQTSGAQTTSTLLIGMPFAGVWFASGIGADPLGQLLHTPLGAMCAFTAVALQCAGMTWTGRMVRSAVAEVR